MTTPARFSASLALLSLCTWVAAARLDAQGTTDVARIERRLWPAVTLAGTSDSGWSVVERMRHYGVAGLSVAVIRDGRIAWARGYGWRDRERQHPVTPTTLFQAGSLSKPMAAAIGLRLVAGGALTLDDDVNRWLRSWRIPADSLTRAQPVTLRLLLSHRAGINVSGFDGYARGVAVPTILQVLRGERPANSAPIVVERRPGQRAQYSGGGYVIAQQLMEDATGQSFDALARHELFTPLGLTRTTYESIADSTNGGDVARGYLSDGAPVPGGWKLLPEQAPASLWTTPSDYAQFVIALQRSTRGESGALLPQDIARDMMTLQSSPEEQQGVGVGLKGNPPFRFSHTGWNDGFRSLMIGYLDRGDGIVLMANGDHGDALLMEYARSVARAYGWDDIVPAIRTPVTLTRPERLGMIGRYRLGEGWVIEVAEREGQLVAGPAGRQLLPLYSESRDTHFFTFADDVGLTTARDASGRVMSIVWRQGTRRTEGAREP